MRILSGRTLVGALALTLVGIAPVTASHGQPADSKSVQRVTDAPEPDAPTDVKVRRANRGALVRWTAPASSSPITEYRLTIRPQIREWTVPGNRTSALIRPLKNGREVTFRVQAISEGGKSVKSEPSNTVVPATTPGRVRAMRVKETKKKFVIRWQYPNSNGEPVLRYRVRVNGTAQAVFGRRFVVRKNRPGTYRIRIRGVNDVGVGRASRLIVVRVAHR
ncbi:hypothetical protein GCM10027020_36350 [Nocardioides salsibiostraticola]